MSSVLPLKYGNTMTHMYSASLSAALSRFALLAPSPEVQWSQKGLVAEDWEPSGAAAAANRQAAWVAVVASERGGEDACLEQSSQPQEVAHR